MQDATSANYLRATTAGLDLIQKALALTSKPLIPEIQRPAVQVLDSPLSEGQIQNYMEHCGIHCPNCLSHDIEGGFVETGDGGASQKVSCNACATEWTDNYALSTISHVKIGTQSTTGGKTIE